MLSFILIIVSVIAVILAFIFIKPKPKQSSINVTKNCIDHFNDLIKRYNATNNRYLMELQQLERKIVMCNDGDAQKQFESIAFEYERTCNEANSYIERCRNCIDNKDFAGAGYCMDQLTISLNTMDVIISSLHNIAPKNQFYEQKSTGANNSVTKATGSESPFQFFTGCKTKEEADARYRSLAKAFHPDSKGGNKAIFLQIQKEYEALRW